jgi:hypothetical protein
MKRTTRRVLWIVALLLVCCVVTNRLTRWFVRADARAVCNDAIDFDSDKAAMTEFVQTRELAEGELLFGERLPQKLANAGIVRVAREGRYLIFRLPHGSLLADDADGAFVYSLTEEGHAIEEFIARVSRKTITYHIQQLPDPRWYYWKFRD